jgi:hypothetical protein
MIIAAMLCLALAQQPPKDVVKPPAPETAEDAAALRRRLEDSLRAAEEKLKKQEAGKSTQEIQKAILGDFDLLLKLLQNPPRKPNQDQPPPEQPPGDTPDSSDRPSSSSGSGPPGGKSSDQSSSSSRSQSGGGRRERKGNRQQLAQMARDGQPNPAGGGTPSRNQQNDKGPKPGDAAGNPGGNPDKGGGATMPNQETGKPEKLADMYRDVWGHLPESLRQEVDHYYRERFMPKYRELLRQYYTRLAETDRKDGPKK